MTGGLVHLVRRNAASKDFIGYQGVYGSRGLTIKSIPEALRPRERMHQLGASGLHVRELLAIILGSGSGGLSSLDLADRLLSEGGLQRLAAMSLEELRAFPGIGSAKACQLKAAIELGAKLASLSALPRRMVSSPADAAALVMNDMRFLDRECFRAILLNTKNMVLEVASVSIGSLSSSSAHPREAYKRAVVLSAASVVFVHNHPSGDPEPSEQDIQLTDRLNQAGKILGISLLDHIIIGDNRFVSLKERTHL